MIHSTDEFFVDERRKIHNLFEHTKRTKIRLDESNFKWIRCDTMEEICRFLLRKNFSSKIILQMLLSLNMKRKFKEDKFMQVNNFTLGLWPALCS